MTKNLPMIQDRELSKLAVVANCSMNRQRGLSGVNSYSRSLQFNLTEHLATGGLSWLDLCCGEGHALKEAAVVGNSVLVGVDLLPPPTHPGVDFVTSAALDFTPTHQFDLITSVHGLHYLGDKLRMLQSLSGWLKPGGLFLAHLDLQNVREQNGKSLARVVLKVLRESGYEYKRNRRLIKGNGPLAFPMRYLGCDPKAGPNYTGQPAVDSYYQRV